MDKAQLCFSLLHLFLFAFIAITAYGLHPFPLGIVVFPFRRGFDDLGWGHSVGFSSIGYFVSLVVLHCITTMGRQIEDRIEGHLQQRGIYYSILATFIQVTRDLFYADNLLPVLYVCLALTLLVLFFDLFAPRELSTVILGKIAKRCIYTLAILFYQGTTFSVDLYFFTVAIPTALIPLVPAALSSYFVVYCSADVPRHRLLRFPIM